MPNDRDLEAAATLETDEYLGELVSTHGPLELAPAEDPFRRLVVSVLRQQVSGAAASAIRERLFDRIDVTPVGISATDAATMREAGVSAAKVEYLNQLAHHWQDNDYSREYFAALSNAEVSSELETIKGIGPWTTDMFLMFGLGRPDVFPVGDLGIRKGMNRLFDDRLTRSSMRDRAERWAPYRSYASRYLWRTVDD